MPSPAPVKSRIGSGLNAEERKLAEHYIVHGNGSAAFKHAYPEKSAKMTSKETAKAGARLLQKPHIREYIALRDRPAEEIVQEISRNVALAEELPVRERFDGVKMLHSINEKDQQKSAVERFWQISSMVGARATRPIPREEFEALVKREQQDEGS